MIYYLEKPPTIYLHVESPIYYLEKPPSINLSAKILKHSYPIIYISCNVKYGSNLIIIYARVKIQNMKKILYFLLFSG